MVAVMSRLQRAESQPAPVLGMQAGLGWRVRRFLGSAGHLLGMLFAIVGVVLLDAGLIGGIEGFAVIALLYATGYFIAARPRLTAFGSSRGKDATRIQASLDELVSAIRMRVADDIYRRVVSIRDAVMFTLDHAGETDQTDPDIYLVRKTAITYLPEALEAYLALPRSYAERQPIEGGRTSHDLLLDQLNLMDVRTRRVAEEVIKRDSQNLVKHGRFLSDRYQDSSLEVVSEPEPVKERVGVGADPVGGATSNDGTRPRVV